MDGRFSSYQGSQQQNGPYSTGSGASGGGMQGIPGVGGSLASHGRQGVPIGGMHMGAAGRGGSSGSIVQPHMQSMGTNRIGSQQHYVQGQGSVGRGPPPSAGYATSPNVGRSPTSYQQQQGALGGGYPSGRAAGPGGGFIPPSGDLLSMLNNSSSNGTAAQQQYPREDGPALSMSDFPSLGGASAAGQQHRNVSQDQGTDAVGVLLGGGRGLSQSPTFGEDDFPALPGAPGNRGPQRVVQRPVSQSLTADQTKINSNTPAIHKQTAAMPGVAQAMPSGDAFGLLGLLNVIRMSDPDLTTLALGTDLTTLGLNLNSPEPLWKTFVSPWAEGPSKQEIDPRIPDSYVASSLQMTREHWYHLKPDTLFYIFYGTPGEESQIRAGAELSRRGWMYHKELKSWITRVPNTTPDQKTDRVEVGSFLVFDVLNWEIVRKDGFTVSLDALESKAKVEEPLQ